MTPVNFKVQLDNDDMESSELYSILRYLLTKIYAWQSSLSQVPYHIIMFVHECLVSLE